MKKESQHIKYRYHELMVHRVHNILLVSSEYDSFILEEDGELTEQILAEYIGMNFNYAPVVTTANTGAKAIDLLNKNKFDLVIVMLRIEDNDPISLGTSIKNLYPRKPVVLLVFDESEIRLLSDKITPKSIDRIFIWSGNASVFPAIIKYVEDRRNATKDILNGNVRAIILIEDSPRMYSLLLPIIYKEIIYLTKNLMDKTLSHSQKLLHLRGRLKVLLTPNFETAHKFLKKYGNNIVGIISDIKFIRNNKIDDNAGIDLARLIKNSHPNMPIVLQSTNIKNKDIVNELDITFLHKKSSSFLNDLRSFMTNNFGFGDFVFRNGTKTKDITATTLDELVKGIRRVDNDTISFHSKNNHFSNWLAARSEFEIASRLRKININDYTNVNILRSEILRELMHTSNYDNENEILKISDGSIGGKGRGLAFSKKMIAKSNLIKKFPELKILVPRTIIIGTDEFDRFIKDNEIITENINEISSTKINRQFLKGKLSIDILLKIETFLKDIKTPLAVRSSSIMEDSQYKPLSGAYSTFMLSNKGTINSRIKKLSDAIKLVFASIFYGPNYDISNDAYQRMEEEKMAVIIMQIVGQEYKSNRFYPTFSGVLKSINYYPVSHMKRSEGISYLALGFGKTIVEGGKCLNVAPKYPEILPQFFSIKSILQNSQSQFYALNLNSKKKSILNGNDLDLYNLSSSVEDNTFKYVGSIISKNDNIIRQSLRTDGTKIVTFNNILKQYEFRFNELLVSLLKIGKLALGCPLEIEFAVNIYEDKNKKPEFNILQMKPLSINTQKTLPTDNYSKNDIFCKSSITLGNGTFENINTLVLVNMEKFDLSKTSEIAEEISSFNKSLTRKNNYILAGPGRWGSSDTWLGIPVKWDDISKVRCIIEIGKKDLPIDPSFGSHFFQNLSNLNIGYITVNGRTKKDYINFDWKEEQILKRKVYKHISVIKFKSNFNIRIDGLTGKCLVLKPNNYLKEDAMNEEESTGI